MIENESEEMYLENILILSEKNSKIRAIDVARYSGYTKPSVSRAMGLLRMRGYITVDTDGYILLTASGNEIAEKILGRHRILKQLLIGLGVNENTASDDACKIEHVISDESFEAICKHIKGI